MKEKKCESKCACGQKILFSIKKPNSIAPTVTSSVCNGCNTKYLFSCMKIGGQFKIKVSVLEMSEKLRNLLQARIHAKKENENELVR